MHKKFGEVRPCGFRVMRLGHTHYSTSLPSPRVAEVITYIPAAKWSVGATSSERFFLLLLWWMRIVTLLWRSEKDDQRSKGKDFEDQTELRVRTVDLHLSLCLSLSRWVCLSVCPHVYLSYHTSELAVARSSFGGVVIRYVLPVLWMTSFVSIIGPMGAWRCRSSLAAVSRTVRRPCYVVFVASCYSCKGCRPGAECAVHRCLNANTVYMDSAAYSERIFTGSLMISLRRDVTWVRVELLMC